MRELLDSIILTPDLRESPRKLGNGRIAVCGKFQQCGIKNRNNRIYPLSVWETHIRHDAPFMNAIRERRVVGQLEHPKDGRPNLGEAAIVLTGLEMRKDGEVWGTLETLSTTAGRTATSLFEDGLSVGISSRAHGSVLRNADGIDEVQSDFLPEGFDLVAEPSTPGAYLKESLDETLGKMMPEDIHSEEQAALCEVRLEALRNEFISSSSYNPLWESRLNDIAFFARQINTDRGVALQDAINAVKIPLNKRRRKYNVKVERMRGATMMTRLIEDAEEAADKAQQSANNAQDVAADIVLTVPEDLDAVSQAKIAAAQAKIAAAEAQAAAKAAAKAKTPEAAELAAAKAVEAAADAADAEQKVTDVADTGVPETVPEAKICHTIELDIDFEGLADDVKKRLNVFRPGEPLDTFHTLVSSELESNSISVKQMDLFWADERLRVKVEVDGDPELATMCIDRLLAPTETSIDVITPEETTESTTRLLVLRQRQRDLVQETQELRRSLLTLQKENDNLRILNQEMTKLFEEKMVGFTVKNLIQEDADLKKIEGLLQECSNIPAVLEMADKFKQALLENRNPAPKSRTKPIVSRKEKRVATLPIHEPRLFPEGPIIPLDESKKTSTGTPKEENTFSRLAAYRKRKQKT